VDHWKHRSDNMKCKTCMWFVPKHRDGDAYHIGRCRRHAPTMNGFPVVYVNDWCGDHKLDENNMRIGGVRSDVGACSGTPNTKEGVTHNIDKERY